MAASANNEQWLSSGKCSLCRRKNYCSKPCTAHKRHMQGELFRAVDNATGGIFSYMNQRVNNLNRR